MNEPHPPPLAAPGESVVCAACGRLAPKQDTILLADAHYCVLCKPQILQRLAEGKPLTSPAAEETRKTYLAHEASVKSIGLLYFLGGAALALGGIGFAVMAFARAQPLAAATPHTGAGPVWVGLTFGLLFMVLAAAEIWVGAGIRRLRPWARIPCGILSGLGLLAFPIGTIINAYILYLVFSKKGAVVFSPGYRAVIQQTPHIKYKTSVVVWVFLGLLVLLFLLIGLGTAFKH
jgi:hypothetical protein